MPRTESDWHKKRYRKAVGEGNLGLRDSSVSVTRLQWSSSPGIEVPDQHRFAVRG
jgi:hypothetical protein